MSFVVCRMPNETNDKGRGKWTNLSGATVSGRQTTTSRSSMVGCMTCLSFLFTIKVESPYPLGRSVCNCICVASKLS